MLSLEDIEIGQQVYREDTHTVWIFKGGTLSEIDNWVESASGSDTVWSGTEDKVIFRASLKHLTMDYLLKMQIHYTLSQIPERFLKGPQM